MSEDTLNQDTIGETLNDTFKNARNVADAGAADIDSTTQGESASTGEAATDPPARSVEEELTYVREQLLRTAAELQNYRRRTEQVRANETAFAKASVIGSFLSVLDDLERTLDAAAGMDAGGGEDVAPATKLHEGVALVHRKFVDELTRMGVTVIPSIGHSFDEGLHEALMQQPAGDDVSPGTIVGEIQKGYQMGNRVLRHAKVIVAA